MSMRRNAKDREYDVGYRKPPRDHRFKKGQSGNPQGRPKNKRQKTPGPELSQQIKNLIMEEAYRPVSLREGDDIVRLPAMQAILRRMNLDALKGNRHAQNAITTMVQAIEDHEAQQQQELFEEAFLYKKGWNEEFERCDKAGIPRPEVVPHPDDILINVRTASVRFVGPMDELEKERWDRLQQRREEALKAIEAYERDLEDDPDNQIIIDDIKHEEKMFEMLDTALPKRRR